MAFAPIKTEGLAEFSGCLLPLDNTWLKVERAEERLETLKSDTNGLLASNPTSQFGNFSLILVIDSNYPRQEQSPLSQHNYRPSEGGATSRSLRIERYWRLRRLIDIPRKRPSGDNVW